MLEVEILIDKLISMYSMKHKMHTGDNLKLFIIRKIRIFLIYSKRFAWFMLHISFDIIVILQL